MAYRRNDGDGRVVGFKDGQPVYKKTNRGEDRKPGNGRERRPFGNDGERRYNDRDRGGKYDAPGEYSGRRTGSTYNRKNDRQDQSFDREGGYRRNDEGGYKRNDEGYRRGSESNYRRDGARRDHTGYRESYDRRERPVRGEAPRSREEAPRFKGESMRRTVEELDRVRPPREMKQYSNLKPLPRDIPEGPREEAELPNIIMGRNPVKEAIKTGRSIDRILVTSEHDGSLNEILDLAFEAKVVVRNVDRAKLDEICMPFGHNGRPGNHQGIIAYVPEAEYCELSDILDYAKEKGEPPFVVLLDGIEDPHNLGSIIRSAECAGAHGIVIPKRRSASVTATVVKTSAGATEHMKIAKVVNLPVAIERLKEAGVWVAGADMGGEPMYNADLKGPFALVVGAEGAGISRLVKEKCDYIVSVPLKGQMESLNASVAAAVIMFEKVRQEND